VHRITDTIGSGLRHIVYGRITSYVIATRLNGSIVVLHQASHARDILFTQKGDHVRSPSAGLHIRVVIQENQHIAARLLCAKVAFARKIESGAIGYRDPGKSVSGNCFFALLDVIFCVENEHDLYPILLCFGERSTEGLQAVLQQY